MGRIDQTTIGGRLKRLESCPLPKREIQFIRIPNLKDDDFVLGVPEMGQGLEQLVHVTEQVGEDDQQAAAVDLGHQFVKHLAQLGFVFRRRASQLVEDRSKVSGSASWRDVTSHLLVKRYQADAVLLLQHQVRQACGGSHSVVVLADGRSARPAIGHRATAIEQNRAAEIRFFLVLTNVEPIGLAEDFPVDRADLVSTNVLPVFLELDTETFVGRAVKPRAKPLHNLPGEHLEVGEFAQIARGKEIGKVGDGTGSWKLKSADSAAGRQDRGAT